MTPQKIKKRNCKECPNYCEPREGYSLGTCIAAVGWVHSLEKMEECPLVEEQEYDNDKL